MNSVHVNNISLVYAAGLVLIALFISYRQKLGLNRDMIISVVRAIIQLTIVGYLLKYIFALNNVLVTGAMVLIIIFNAAHNAAGRGSGIPVLAILFGNLDQYRHYDGWFGLVWSHQVHPFADRADCRNDCLQFNGCHWSLLPADEN